MKLIFILIAISIFTIAAKAQEAKERSYKIKFSLGAEASLPIGLFGDVYSFGIGISEQQNFPIAKATNLTLYLGYINYFLTTNYGGGSGGYFPLQGGIEQLFLNKFFASIQSGIAFRTHGLGNTFIYSGGIGYKINKNFSVLFKYFGKIKTAINSNAVGMRVAYTF